MWIAIALITVVLILVIIAINYGKNKKENQIDKENLEGANEDNKISAGPFIDDPLNGMRNKK